METMNKMLTYATFYINNIMYGIDVQKVQEITRQMNITPVPLTPTYICGLINLRGELATSIALRQLFSINTGIDEHNEKMNVICKIEGVLLALLVDEIGEVEDVVATEVLSAPENISENIRKFMTGVYKVKDKLLSVIDIEKVYSIL